MREGRKRYNPPSPNKAIPPSYVKLRPLAALSAKVSFGTFPPIELMQPSANNLHYE